MVLGLRQGASRTAQSLHCEPASYDMFNELLKAQTGGFGYVKQAGSRAEALTVHQGSRAEAQRQRQKQPSMPHGGRRLFV